MPVLLYLLMGCTYGFAAAVQPGPFQTYLVSQTLTVGWRRTLPATAAPLISDVPVATLVLLVLSQVPPWLVHLLHIGGGMFVLYLALGAYQSWRHFESEQAARAVPRQRSVLKAAAVNLLNPNPYIGWSLVMGPLLLQAWRATSGGAAALLVAFYGTMMLVSIGIILLFAVARNLGPRLDRVMLGLSSAGLAGFGLYQLWLGIGG